jgi:hypothetical protein
MTDRPVDPNVVGTSPSRKVAGIRDWWATQMSERDPNATGPIDVYPAANHDAIITQLRDADVQAFGRILSDLREATGGRLPRGLLPRIESEFGINANAVQQRIKRAAAERQTDNASDAHQYRLAQAQDLIDQKRRQVRVVVHKAEPQPPTQIRVRMIEKEPQPPIQIRVPERKPIPLRCGPGYRDESRVAETASTDLSEMDLPELAAVANQHLAAAETAGRSMLESAWHAGSALLAAKAQVKHGEWATWLEANFHGSDRTARAYMRVATANGNRQTSADLPAADVPTSINAALRAISKPKPAAPHPANPKPTPPATEPPIRPDVDTRTSEADAHNLKHLIRAVSDGWPASRSAQDVAREVSQQTPPSKLRRFYEEALRELIPAVWEHDLDAAMAAALPTDRRPTKEAWNAMLESRVDLE